MAQFWFTWPRQCLLKTVRLISDTTAPVLIFISIHLSLMPTNTISLCTEAVSPEVIECVSSSCSCLSTLCVWRFLGPLVSFLFKQAAEMWPQLQVASLKRHIENIAFTSPGISSVDGAYIRLCKCGRVGAGCYVANIFISTFHRQGYLSSLVEI